MKFPSTTAGIRGPDPIARDSGRMQSVRNIFWFVDRNKAISFIKSGVWILDFSLHRTTAQQEVQVLDCTANICTYYTSGQGKKWIKVQWLCRRAQVSVLDFGTRRISYRWRFGGNWDWDSALLLSMSIENLWMLVSKLRSSFYLPLLDWKH